MRRKDKQLFPNRVKPMVENGSSEHLSRRKGPDQRKF